MISKRLKTFKVLDFYVGEAIVNDRELPSHTYIINHNRNKYALEFIGPEATHVFNKAKSLFAAPITHEQFTQAVKDYDIAISGEITEAFNEIKEYRVSTFDIRERKEKTEITFTKLNEVEIVELPKYPLYFRDITQPKPTQYNAEYGRISMIAGVSGGGKTYNALYNSHMLLVSKHFDLVLYIAKELGNSRAHKRFQDVWKGKTKPHEGLVMIDDPHRVTETNLLQVIQTFADQNPGKKILYVLDNGTNFALDVDDTSKAGLGKLAVNIHEWLLVNTNNAVLWLTQVQREHIRDLFKKEKNGDQTFTMSLGNLKSSSVLQELADTVIGIAKDPEMDKRYHSKALKNGGE